MSQLIIYLLSVVSIKLFGLCCWILWTRLLIGEKVLCMKYSNYRRKQFLPSEFSLFLFSGIFGRFRTRPYLRMLIQTTVFALQRASLFIKNLWVLKGKPLKKWCTSLSFLVMHLLVFLWFLEGREMWIWNGVEIKWSSSF